MDNLTEIKSIDKGLLYLYLEHTSASLTINENTDEKVRKDLESYLNKIVPENEPIVHTLLKDRMICQHILNRPYLVIILLSQLQMVL